LVLLFALAVRLSVPVVAFLVTDDGSVFHSGDTGSYLVPAENIIKSCRFARDNAPDIFRTPGYPILLVPGILLKNVEAVTIGLQVVLSCLTVYLVFSIAMALFRRRDVAVTCAALYAVEPLSILYGSLLLTETLFTTAIALFLHLVIKYIQDQTSWEIIVASVALSAAIYVKPIAYFLPAVTAGVLLVWVFTRTGARRKLLVQISVFFLISTSLVFAWQFRNKVLTGYSGFSSVTCGNLYFYQASAVLAEKRGTSMAAEMRRRGGLDPEIYFSLHPEQRDWSPARILNYQRDEGIRIIVENPLPFLKAFAKGGVRALIGPGLSGYLKLFKVKRVIGRTVPDRSDGSKRPRFMRGLENKPAVVLWGNLLLGLLILTYIVFAVIALLSRDMISRVDIILLAVCAAYFIVLAGAGGYSRFRHASMPAICVLAGYGLSLVIDRFASVPEPSRNHLDT